MLVSTYNINNPFDMPMNALGKYMTINEERICVFKEVPQLVVGGFFGDYPASIGGYLCYTATHTMCLLHMKEEYPEIAYELDKYYFTQDGNYYRMVEVKDK